MASFIHELSLIPLFLLLLYFPYIASSQTNITVGSVIVAGDDKAPGHWLSPSGDFAFGFSHVVGTDSFLLTTWFDKIPEKTIVWYARKSGPVPEGSRLEVTSDRGLVINDPDGGYLWSTDTVISRISHGFFEDSGNFGLRDENSETTWESFDSPTDTILPGQEIKKNGVILISQRSGSNITDAGRFRLDLQDGRVQLKTVNLPASYENDPYYQSNATDEATSPGTGVGFDSSAGYLYILHQNGEKSQLTPPESKVVSSKDYYLRATIESDGVFIQYSYPKKASTEERKKWSSVWAVPDNICIRSMEHTGGGPCGYNRICRLGLNP